MSKIVNKQLIFIMSGLSAVCFFLLVNLDAISKILLLVLLCAFTTAFLKPKLGLLLIIIVRPSLDILTTKPIIETDNFGLNLASLFAVAVILFAVIILIKNLPKNKTLPLKYNWLVFIIIALASIFFSYNNFLSLAESLRLLSILAIYCLAYVLLKSESDLKNLIIAIIVSAFIPSIFALYQFYTATGLTVPFEGIYNRIYGTFAHPNLFAYYLLLPLTLSLYTFLNNNKKDLFKKVNNILYFLLAAFFIIILTFTFTRGAWLSLLIIMIIIGVFHYRVLLVSALIFAALAYFFIAPINYRVNDLISGRAGNSIEWRLNLWRDVREYITEQPWLGHGAGTANDLILDKRGEQLGSSDPHNDYLKIIIENGLIGLLAYLLLIAGLFINLIKKYSLAGQTQFKILILMTIALAIAFYLMSAADNILRNTALMWSFWALMGAVLAQSHA